MRSELVELFSFVLDWFKAILGDDSEAGIVFLFVVILLFITLETDGGRSIAGQVGSSLSCRHARLNSGIDHLLGLRVAVEALLNLFCVAAEARVDQVLSHLSSEERDADLVEPQPDQHADVERLICLVDHHSQSQWVVQQHRSRVQRGLELEDGWRSNDASNDSADWAKNSDSWADEEVWNAVGLPVVQRLEHVETQVHRHQSVQGYKNSKAEEVLVASASLGWDAVVLEEQHPKRVPPSTEAKHLMLA